MWIEFWKIFGAHTRQMLPFHAFVLLYTAVVLVTFMLYTAVRMSARPAVPAGQRRSRFRNLLRTSFFFNKLADKDRNGEH